MGTLDERVTSFAVDHKDGDLLDSYGDPTGGETSNGCLIVEVRLPGITTEV